MGSKTQSEQLRFSTSTILNDRMKLFSSGPSLLLRTFLLLVVGCQSIPVPNLVPAGQEKQMGQDAYAEVKKTEKISTDPHFNELVQRVGKRIAAVANQPDFEWEFTVFDSKEMNAFCLPGGKVGVYTGILPVMANEAGLAVVLGHEVAHATLHHGAKRVSQGMLVQFGIEGFDLALLKDSKYRSFILAGLGLGAQGGILLPYSRANESEADATGVLYMAQAGYDPAEAPELWKRFTQIKGQKGPPQFLSTHPSDSSRINKLTELQPQAQAAYATSPKYGRGEKL